MIYKQLFSSSILIRPRTRFISKAHHYHLQIAIKYNKPGFSFTGTRSIANMSMEATQGHSKVCMYGEGIRWDWVGFGFVIR